MKALTKIRKMLVIFVLAFVIMAMFALVACGNDRDDNDDNTDPGISGSDPGDTDGEGEGEGEGSNSIFTAPINAIIEHDAELTEGWIYLLSDGTGYVRIQNKETTYAIVDCEITYSVADGAFTIVTAPDSKLTVPVAATVEENSVSITITNTGSTGATTEYEFDSELYKLTQDYDCDDMETFEAYYPLGMEVNLAYVSRDDYKLTSLEVNGEEKTVEYGESFTMPAEDVSVLYVWEAIPTKTFTVVYKAGDGEGEDYSDTVKIQITSEEVSASYRLLYNTEIGFTRDGYEFAGWVVGGVNRGQGVSITLTEDTTEVTARWNQVFTVSYDNVGGDDVTTNLTEDSMQYSSTDSYILPYATKQFIPVNIYFTKEGYILKGWTSSADKDTADEGKVYAPGTAYTLTQNTVFTAVWEEEQQESPLDAYNGEYTGTISFDNDDYDKAVIDGNTLKLQEGIYEPNSFELTVDTSGEKLVARYTKTVLSTVTTITLTFEDENTFTIVYEQTGGFGGTTTANGTFTRVSPLAEYEGTYTGAMTVGSYAYDKAIISGNTLTLQEDDYEPDVYELTIDTTGEKVVGTYTKTTSSMLGTTTTTITVTFNGDNTITVKYEKGSTTVTATFTLVAE